ncbi:MAG: S41 family peptidase [bacterium]|nr:S41 family peptidase [bacterium]
MRNSRSQFLALLLFLAITLTLLTNGFTGRISAQSNDVDVITEIAPIGEVLDHILRSYVREPVPAEVVEGALEGMMNSLDEHSSYISAKFFKQLTEDTMGEFEGIGVSIKLDENKNIKVFQPISGSPAEKAGVIGGDIILKIDDVPTKGMSTQDAADRIRGPRGTIVKLGVLRQLAEIDPDGEDASQPEVLDIEIKRGKIPLESIVETRLLDGGIGYIRVGDFKRNTAEEIAGFVKDLSSQGMRALVLDLRWNPGGLLTSAREVSELFLPKNTLVTYTKGRDPMTGELKEEMRLFTQREPVIPETVPMVLLINEHTASSSEIVTGALQFWSRALVLGQKTYGKGSVQTLIELTNPPGSALRLTTGLYYTPADVTIDKQGIFPDIEVLMSIKEWVNLLRQMNKSYAISPEMKNRQNHGTVTGNTEAEEGLDELAEDIQLQRAVEILNEEAVFQKLIEKYHKDTHETQMAAADSPESAGDEVSSDAVVR